MVERLKSLWCLLRDLLNRSDPLRTVILMDSDWSKQSRVYKLQPRDAWLAVAGYTVLVAVVVGVAVTAIPLDTLFGFESGRERARAKVYAVRLDAINDSLRVQEDYLRLLQALITSDQSADLQSTSAAGVHGHYTPHEQEIAGSGDWVDHEQPAISLGGMPSLSDSAELPIHDGTRYLTSLRLPTLGPVSGVVTRAFDARAGHYGIDIATSEGNLIRAIGDGYVILADWTHTGGHTIAIQHTDGHISVYKHNSRLLKRLADRVQQRDAIAISGDSGNYSSGPHLHFELWHNGLAQDPGSYLLDM